MKNIIIIILVIISLLVLAWLYFKIKKNKNQSNTRNIDDLVPSLTSAVLMSNIANLPDTSTDHKKARNKPNIKPLRPGTVTEIRL